MATAKDITIKLGVEDNFSKAIEQGFKATSVAIQSLYLLVQLQEARISILEAQGEQQAADLAALKARVASLAIFSTVVLTGEATAYADPEA